MRRYVIFANIKKERQRVYTLKYNLVSFSGKSNVILEDGLKRLP